MRIRHCELNLYDFIMEVFCLPENFLRIPHRIIFPETALTWGRSCMAWRRRCN